MRAAEAKEREERRRKALFFFSLLSPSPPQLSLFFNFNFCGSGTQGRFLTRNASSDFYLKEKELSCWVYDIEISALVSAFWSKYLLDASVYILKLFKSQCRAYFSVQYYTLCAVLI